jgi:hypothetical protein
MPIQTMTAPTTTTTVAHPLLDAMRARQAARRAGSAPLVGGTTPTAVGGAGAVSPPGTQTTNVAGSLQGYTPPTPNAAVPIGKVNGIDPVKVTPNSLGDVNPYIDAAYNQATSRLDPQFASAEARFRQDMVNRGIAQGSDAYNNAWDDFSRSKNDAYGSAMNAAMGQGLAAQGQLWGQGVQQTQLAQAMRQWADQFGLNRDQLDLNAQNQFTQQSMDAYKLNQLSEQQKFMMAQAMLGMVPNQSPTPIDVMGPYQLQQNGAIANNQSNQNSSNGFWGAVGNLGSAWLS